MDEHNHEYRTGSTQPQKSSSGLIAALLICIILLCGLVSAMGLLNIKLSHRLQALRAETDAPLSFAAGENACDNHAVALYGMVLEELPPLYRQLHDLPEGLYVCQIAPGGVAEGLGILPGDVLVAADGAPITSAEHLPIDPKTITLSRDGEETTYSVLT